MFNNNQYNNNGSNQVNVNTRFYASYSDTACVILGGWNANVSLKMQPCTGVNADGIRQYATDNNQQISTALTEKNVILLLAGIKDTIIPAMKEAVSSSISVVAGVGPKAKIITIGFDGEHAYLSIATNLGSDGSINENSVMTHVFTEDSYKNKDGIGIVVFTDFEAFCARLKSAKEDMAPIIAHSIKYAEAQKNAFGGNRQQGGGGYQQHQPQQQYQAPTNNFSGGGMEFLPFN